MAKKQGKTKRQKVDMKLSREIIDEIAIPSRPTVMLNALKAINAFAPDLSAITAIINLDVVLAADVLMVANSKPKTAVSAIDEAVVLIGLRSIRKIISNRFLKAALIGNTGLAQVLRQRFVQTAQTAAWLTNNLREHSPHFAKNYFVPGLMQQAYTAGLLYNCGASLMLQKFSDYSEVYQDAIQSNEQSLADIELQRYHTNHGVLGGLLCESWNLPISLCHVVSNHHGPLALVEPKKKTKKKTKKTTEIEPLLAIVKLAEHIQQDVSPYEQQTHRAALMSFFELNEHDIDQLQKQVNTSIVAPKEI